MFWQETQLYRQKAADGAKAPFRLKSPSNSIGIEVPIRQ